MTARAPATTATAVSHAPRIAAELGLRVGQVQAAVDLLGDGATVPFIARYRKEATGALDEAQLRDLEARHDYLVALSARRETILQELARQGVLDDALRQQLEQAATKGDLEDLYFPFKPKRRTRASMARERGLEPLAKQMWQQEGGAPASAARGFVDAAKDVPDVAAALAGARDICAERLAEDPALRARVRAAFREHGQFRVSKAKAHRDGVTKFDDYAKFEGRGRDMPAHRVLAIERGEREGVLQVKVEIEQERHYRYAATRIPMRDRSPWQDELRSVVEDALKRLLAPSARSEYRTELRHEAELAAVDVFARNLRELLLAPAFGGRPVLGIDPGQRTGCKCALVSETGALIAHDVIYLVQGEAKLEQARATLRRLLGGQVVGAVAVGNGTHGRETERFVKKLLADDEKQRGTPGPVCVSVSEAGASIYSASDIARQEFPDLDLTVRGAISIARRLQDPLAELIKLDPKTIGVGQYQHDVDQSLLATKLTVVVESAVNAVGVELNTASAKLLSFVSGIGPKLAENIVAHRDRQGRLDSRKQLLEVRGLGPKAFEQAAGFLRIRGGKHPLDASAVHPERYALVTRMARDVGTTVVELVGNVGLVQRIDLSRYREADVGTYTLTDIVEELSKPGRDPRDTFEAPAFQEGVETLEDLTPGMVVEGIVTNVTAFGAFVDVGVHQDGLVHVSQLTDRFVRDPAEVAHVGQRLRVKVLSVDLQRRRISLTARNCS